MAMSQSTRRKSVPIAQVDPVTAQKLFDVIERAAVLSQGELNELQLRLESKLGGDAAASICRWLRSALQLAPMTEPHLAVVHPHFRSE